MTERYISTNINLIKLLWNLANKPKTNQRRGNRGRLIELRLRRSRWFSEGKEKLVEEVYWSTKMGSNPSTTRRMATCWLDLVILEAWKRFDDRLPTHSWHYFHISAMVGWNDEWFKDGIFLTIPLRFVQDKRRPAPSAKVCLGPRTRATFTLFQLFAQTTLGCHIRSLCSLSLYLLFPLTPLSFAKCFSIFH